MFHRLTLFLLWLEREITAKIRMLFFVLLNSVLFNLSCVWILLSEVHWGLRDLRGLGEGCEREKCQRRWKKLAWDFCLIINGLEERKKKKKIFHIELIRIRWLARFFTAVTNSPRNTIRNCEGKICDWENNEYRSAWYWRSFWRAFLFLLSINRPGS